MDWGSIVLLALGALAVVMAVLKPPEKTVALSLQWIFGVLLAGLGVFGLAFFDPYSALVKDVAAFLAEPTPEGAKDLADRAGSKGVPEGYRALATGALLANPIPETRDILENAAKSATDPAARLALDGALKRFDQAAADAAKSLRDLPADFASRPELLQKLDPQTKRMVTGYLVSLPAAKAQNLDIDPNRLAVVAKQLRVPER